MYQFEMVKLRAAKFITTDSEIYTKCIVFVTCYSYNTWTGAVLKRGANIYARLVMMYKIVSENIAIIKQDRLEPPLRQSRDMYSCSFITCCHSPSFWMARFKHSRLMSPLSILICETCKYFLTFSNCYVPPLTFVELWLLITP